MTATTSQIASAASVKPQIRSKTASIFAILLGLGIVGFIGFSHIDVVHNAAHDTRHSFAFPCH